MFFLVAGCASSTYPEKRSETLTGWLTGKVVGVDEEMEI